MYNARFDKDNGDSFYLDFEHGIIFDIDPLSELGVNISTSQGFEQVGVSVENRMVEGVIRTVRGRIVGDANATKEEMLRIFSPFSEGKLYFNDKFYCDCVVQTTPAIGVLKKDVVFTFELFCAYPFWLIDEETEIGSTVYTPCFLFPDPTSGEDGEYHGFDQHIFAIKNESTFFNVYNASEVDTRFEITFYTTSAIVSNYGVTNVRTGEFIKIADTLDLYEKVRVYWNGARLKVEKTDIDGNVTDIFSKLDEDSDLFWLYQGDNILQAFADDGFPDVSIKYQQTYVGVYDGK